MPSSTFVFKQFTIEQDKCAMKVGTDAVILGAWATPKNAKKILDIGTGTGIIALMMAQNSTAEIDAIEIEIEAYEQAVDNVRFSKWNSKIKVHHISFQNFYLESQKKYDLIISNPPYFIDSFKSKKENRTNARHSDLLPYQTMLDGVSKLLENDGKFFVILPNKEADIFRDLAKEKGLHLSKLLRVRTKHDQSTEKRHVMRFEFSPKSFSEDTIVIEKDNRHEYTEEYKELTKDFYLSF